MQKKNTMNTFTFDFVIIMNHIAKFRLVFRTAVSLLYSNSTLDLMIYMLSHYFLAVGFVKKNITQRVSSK